MNNNGFILGVVCTLGFLSIVTGLISVGVKMGKSDCEQVSNEQPARSWKFTTHEPIDSYNAPLKQFGATTTISKDEILRQWEDNANNL